MSNAEASSSKTPSPAVDFTAGVIAGAVGLVVGQPFDVVKVRYQTPSFSTRYSSTFGALQSILREEGGSGLFKGVMSPMCGIALINGMIFSSYSMLMRLQHDPRSDAEAPLSQILLAGAGSGILGAFITSPTELVKVRQQSAPAHLNPSVPSVINQIIRQDGLRGLYRGFTATALRDLAYGPYFFTYEAVCRGFKSLKASPDSNRHYHGNLIDEAEADLQSLSWPELMTAGGVAGVAAWIVTFPVDVFKTRMQAMTSGGGRALSVWQTGRMSVRQEGWRVMFAGLGPTLIRAVPVNMVIFLSYELILSSLSRASPVAMSETLL